MKSWKTAFGILALAALLFLSFVFVANAAPTVCGISTGCTGTSTAPAYGKILVGGKNGEYELVASSTLGGTSGVNSVFGRNGAVTAQSGDYTTSQVTEGSNFYWTQIRFDNALTATTSLPHITTLASLSLPYSQLTGTPNLGAYLTLANWYATTTDQLAEGVNHLYFTNPRADARFVAGLAATTSVKSITTLPSLSLPYSQITGAPSGAASTTLLIDNNTFSGNDTFSNTITGSVSGSAATATKLATPRAINTVNFDGTAAITITAASSSALGDANTFSGVDKFTNALSDFSGTWQTFVPSHFQIAGAYLTAAPVATSSAETAGQLAAWGTTNGTPAKLYSVPTTTASCAGTASCSAFAILGSTPVTITGAAGSSGNVATSAAETAGQLPYWATTNGSPAKLAGVSTSSLSVDAPLSTAGTLGFLVSGSAPHIGCQTASGSQAGCLSAASFNLFNNKLATGTAVTLGQLAVFGGPASAPTIYSAPTTTASCAGSTSCSTFTILGSSPITITGSASSGGVGTSTEPFMAKYFVATSTLIASQFPYASTTQITSGNGAVASAAVAVGINGGAGLYLAGTNTLGLTNGVAGLSWNGTAFYPNTDSARNLGIDATNRWNNLYTNYASSTALTVSGSAYFPGSGTWNASGNVGIGTTTPPSKLWVLGAQAAPSLSNDGAIAQFGGVAATQALAFGLDSNSPFEGWIQAKRSNNDGSSFPLALNPLGGNVGIGTTNPGTALSNNASVVNDYFGIGVNASGFNWNTASGASQYIAGFENPGAASGNRNVLVLRGANSDNGSYLLSAVSNMGPVLSVTQAGNVGLATTTPWGMFSINTPMADNTTGTAVFPLLTIASSTSVGTTTVFQVNSNGKIGIASTTPGSVLSVGSVANLTAATSTFYATGGINLAGGCFAINGTCISGSAGGSGTVTNIATTYPLLGGPITTTGTLSLAFGTTTANTWGALNLFGNATSTLFTSTSAWITNASTTVLSASGSMYVNNQKIVGEQDGSYTVASSTLTYAGAGASATTTIITRNPSAAITITKLYCVSYRGTGTAVVAVGSGTATTSVSCNNSGGSVTGLSIPIASRGPILYDWGNLSGTADFFTPTISYTVQ